jgi:hypothetical protein
VGEAGHKHPAQKVWAGKDSNLRRRQPADLQVCLELLHRVLRSALACWFRVQLTG